LHGPRLRLEGPTFEFQVALARAAIGRGAATAALIAVAEAATAAGFVREAVVSGTRAASTE
jgi:hypothetical protein